MTETEFNNSKLKVMLSAEQIKERIRQLGEQITNDYRGRDLLMIGVLKGACVFLSDLMRHIDLPMMVDFIAVTSYGAATKSSGEVRILKDSDASLRGRDVLIVEDIVDTGLTLSYLIDIFRRREAASVEIVAFLDKPERRIKHVDVKYVGFEIPNSFVVGYGLDYGERYRNLPFVGLVESLD
ncbi:MAG: hypoxanthine phosphoribosyltransferase [Acidobacteriota bacterium]|nr:hypoxanthine phosphoribosyltransferase [Blastocatellia bacterium]MDW8411076.1 hypoxanthine phosphoribosyltransferase [Acidobacteriota bacterium]